MALLDFLKRKKEVEKSKPAIKTEKTSVKEPEKTDLAPQKPVSKKTSGFSYEAVQEPHISEKATNLSEKNQYIFKVSPNYNKKEVKKAIEGIYGVDVLSVNIIKIPSKKRRMGRIEGHKKGFTKAVVKIKQGQKIEII